MKNILCFGDSNTWGFIPAKGDRYDYNTRWTGIVQKELGEEYRILEDGMNARTTAYDDPSNPYLVGRDTLPMALIAQKPLDLMVLMLGTNDLKFTDAKGSARGAAGLIDLTLSMQNWPTEQLIFPNGVKILLVSPIHLHENISSDLYSVFSDSYEDSLNFRNFFERVANNKGVYFMDAAEYAEPSIKDCVHMEPGDHRKLGIAIAAKIREIIG